MEDIFTDDPDGKVDGGASELLLAAMANFRRGALSQAAVADFGSALSQAALPDYGRLLAQVAMAQLPDARDFLHLAGINGGAIYQSAGRDFDVHDSIAAMVKRFREESEAMRCFQEEIMTPAVSAAMSAMLHDLRLTTGNLIKANEMLGLSEDWRFGLSNAAFRLSGNRAFGLASGLNRERESLLGMDWLPDALLTGVSAIIPPTDFLLTDNARRAQTVVPPSRLFTGPFQQCWPPVLNSDRLLIGNGFYQADYPNSPADDAADVLPHDAVLIHEMRVSGGSLTQIGNLLDHFFGLARSPERYFVVRDRLERRWTIYHAEGTGRDARERARDGSEVAGYLVGVDLPVAIVEVYGVAQSDRPLIGSFVERLQEEIKSTGFKLAIAGQKSKREPPGGVLERVKAVCKLREEKKRKGVVLITRTAACQLKGIDERTFKKYEPEIYERWEDSEI